MASVLWGLNLPLSAALLKHFDPFWISPLRFGVQPLAEQWVGGAVVLAGVLYLQ